MSGKIVINTIAASMPKKNRNQLSVGVLASYNGSNLQALIDFSKSESSLFSIDSVISNNPNSFALTRAQREGIAHNLIDHRAFDNKASFEDAIVSFLKSPEIDLVVLAGFMRVLSADFLGQFHQRIINLHPSLLPKYRGINAIKKAFDSGDTHTGCTVHLVDRGLDTGPIIAQSACPILSEDSLADVEQRIQKEEHLLLPKIVNEIAKAVVAKDFV